MNNYDHKKVEKKWRKTWEEKELYKTPDEIKGKDNEYILVEFAYPSGNLHVGHWYAFAVTDIYARYRRMQGKNVMFPFGFDAFGLPAENAAIQHGLNPKDWTYKNMETMREQLKTMGAMFDWSREVITCSPDYYKWTQDIFLKLFKAGLVERKTTIVNWDPVDKTVLANEQVLADGTADRSGAKVEKKELEHWVMKIPKYADKLIDDLDKLNWPEEIKDSQKNWIGRKEGINLSYKCDEINDNIICFTTRPDTNFGATFLVLGPEHEFLKKYEDKLEDKESVEKYIKESVSKSEIDRLAEGRKKTGVFTGWYVINPLNNKKLPVYVSDFVLGNVGTGAVIGVPGHDLRDFEFAQIFDLEVVRVVVANDGDTSEITKPEQVQEFEGTMINSEFLDGMEIKVAIEKMMDYIEKEGWGKRVVNYKLRDWIISRQRYWGCPIPIINCSNCGPVPVPEKDLPVELPEIDDYLPRDDGKSPLAKATEWMSVKCPKCGEKAERETDTFDTFIDSSWYFLRYIDPKNTEEFASKDKLSKWMPINFYSGGQEHTNGHLLYSRFFHKALFDLGLVNENEPFLERLNRGLILGSDGNKMSKSKGNVIDPDKEVEKFGADTVRGYLAFIGPYNETGSYPWDSNGIIGIRRFVEKISSIDQKVTDQTSEEIKKLIHQTIKKVGEDSQKLKFNTAISQLMILITKILKEGIRKEDAKIVVTILAPYVPFIAEELWNNLGGNGSVHEQNWPKYDESLISSDTVKIAIQINGKVRDEIEIDINSTEEDVKRKTLERANVKKWLEDKEPKKVIYIKDKILSIVI
jgi:leucyl-tRNA synthetase